MKKFSSYMVPSLIASVLMSMYAVVDGIFIGQKIGDIGLAAINISWPITALLQAFGTAFGLAAGIHHQLLLAKKDDERASYVKMTALIMLVFLAVFLGLTLYFCKRPLLTFLGATSESLNPALSYTKIILIGSIFQMLGMAMIPILKNSKRVKLAMAASLTSIFTNLLFDYLFILVFDFGLAGAAWGSVIAQMISCFVCLIPFLKENRRIAIHKEDIIAILKISIAPFVLAYAYSVVILITNLFCTSIGGDAAVAAYTLLSYLAYINIALACACGDSIQPLFSYYQGLKDYKTNQKMLIRSLLISLIICTVLAMLMLILKRPLGELYHLSDEAFAYYEKGLPFYAGGALLVAIIKVISSYLYSVDQKIASNIIVILEPFVLTPALLAIFALNLDMLGVWIAYILVQVCSIGVSIGLLLYCQKKISKTN